MATNTPATPMSVGEEAWSKFLNRANSDQEAPSIITPGATKGGPPEEYGFKMVILDKGFVYLCWVTIDPTHTWVYLDKTFNVRRWGTDKGLGQLAKGPRPDTQIDAVGRVQIPYRVLQQMIDVDEVAWMDVLRKEGIDDM